LFFIGLYLYAHYTVPFDFFEILSVQKHQPHRNLIKEKIVIKIEHDKMLKDNRTYRTIFGSYL
jgi:hypothetical protein